MPGDWMLGLDHPHCGIDDSPCWSTIGYCDSCKEKEKRKNKVKGRRETMDRPMTTAELFEKIQSILQEKGKLPDILDYGLEDDSPVPIRTYEFELRNSLKYGGSEGIYLDLYIDFYEEDERCIRRLGTYKTLRGDDEAMHIMAALLADFIIEEDTYVNKNIDDFTWRGADADAFDESGKRIEGYTCRSMDAALKKKDELLKKYPQVIIRDNPTRKETVYNR